MKFISLASSSAGNAYLLQSQGVSPLLLEAGIPIKRLREALYAHGLNLSELAGCLISHEHMDHAKAVKDLMKAGVDCFMSAGTMEALQIEKHHRAYKMQTGNSYVIRRWKVLPFDLKHDAAEPMGFLISHADDTLLFIPDTAYVKPRFKGITIISCECNHIEEILSDNINKGLPAVVGRRTRRNHMSLSTLIKMLKANDLSKCREIHLLHLSDGNSDEARMIREVQEQTGIPCFAGEK